MAYLSLRESSFNHTRGRTMFKKLTLIVTIILMAIVLSGCIQIKMETKLKKDASGKGKVELTIVQSVTEALDEVKDIEDLPETLIGNLAALDGEALKDAVTDRDVKIKKFKSRIEDGCRKVSFEVDFKTLEDYSFVLATAFEEEGAGFGIFDAGNGNLRLKDAEYDVPARDVEEDEIELENPSDEAMDKYLELVPKINAAMGEVEVVNIITVPGDVIESDATETNGRTCTWRLDFATIRSDKDSLKPNIVFSGKGLKIEPMQDQ